MRNVLDFLIDDFHERDLPELVPRDRQAPQVAGKANAVVGMRRAGKTWFCYQRMRELLDKNVRKERLLYLNFEDERLLPFSAADFQSILDTYYRKFPAFKNQRCHLFLDEVQRIEGWDRFVRRVLDTENLSIWVTGSSSKLLSTEIASSLRGRSLSTEIFPLSFREFLAFQGVDSEPGAHPGSRARATLQHMAGRYLEQGGFPEVQRLEGDLRRQILQNYLDVVILRDVVERFSVRNTTVLRSLIRHIMSAPATRFSVNKFYGTLRSQGVQCTKNSLYDYLDHLSDAYLVYQAPIHSRSAKARQVNPKKVYAIDTGLLRAMSFQMTEDRGALLENLVYMHLRRQGIRAEYYAPPEGGEVDFVVPAAGNRGRRLIQVCWSLGDPATRRREMGRLRNAMTQLRLRRGTVVTWLDEDSPGGGIEIIPAWKWLLTRLH